MLDLFKRPDDPQEHNYLFALPAVAMCAALWVARGTSYLPMVTEGVYLASSALCIGSIGCLSHQASARTGTALGVVGVTGGMAATLAGMEGLATAVLGQVRLLAA